MILSLKKLKYFPPYYGSCKCLLSVKFIFIKKLHTFKSLLIMHKACFLQVINPFVSSIFNSRFLKTMVFTFGRRIFVEVIMPTKH